MSKQPEQDGNFFTDILIPFLAARIFKASVVYSVLKWTKLF